MAARSAIIRGRVQGVGFRSFVQNLAHHHGVSGKVWNCRDGSVETEFEHEDPAVLDRFAEALKNGPGRVDSVTVQPLVSELNADGFQVSHSR